MANNRKMPQVNDIKALAVESWEKLHNGEFDHKEMQAVTNMIGKLTALATAQLKLAEMRNEKPRIAYLVEDEQEWEPYVKKYFGPRTKANLQK